MALQLLHGDIEQLRREYMVLFARGVSITRKLGFSDIIMPGSDPTTTRNIQGSIKDRCRGGGLVAAATQAST